MEWTRSEIVFLFVFRGCRGCLSARNQCKKSFLLSLHFVKHERHFSRFSPFVRCRHFPPLFALRSDKKGERKRDFPINGIIIIFMNQKRGKWKKESRKWKAESGWWLKRWRWGNCLVHNWDKIASAEIQDMSCISHTSESQRIKTKLHQILILGWLANNYKSHSRQAADRR